MKSEPSILDRLDAPTKAPYWPVGVEGRSCGPNQVSPVIQLILLLSNNHVLNLGNKRVETWMTIICKKCSLPNAWPLLAQSVRKLVYCYKPNYSMLTYENRSNYAF